MSSFLSTRGLARITSRHPWRTLGFWLVLLVLAAVMAPRLGDALTTEGNFTNRPESVVGDDLLEERLRGERPMTETIIVRSETATVDDAAFRSTVDGLVAQLTAMPEIVTSAASYYGTGAEDFVSQDRHTTIIPVTLVGDLDEATEQRRRVQGSPARRVDRRLRGHDGRRRQPQRGDQHDRRGGPGRG